MPYFAGFEKLIQISRNSWPHTWNRIQFPIFPDIFDFACQMFDRVSGFFIGDDPKPIGTLNLESRRHISKKLSNFYIVHRMIIYSFSNFCEISTMNYLLLSLRYQNGMITL